MFVYSQTPLAEFSSPKSVKQVDLVPTLAALLGIPIPFSNLGALIIDSLPTKDWKILLHHLWSNIQQVIEYIQYYAMVDPNTFDEGIMRKRFEQYEILKREISNVNSKEDFERFSISSVRFIIEMREMCEDVWIQFDSFSMTRGLLILFLTTFCVFLIVDGIPMDRLDGIFTSTFISYSYCAVGLSGLVSCALYYLKFVDNLLLSVYFTTSTVSLFMLAVLIIQNWETIALYWYERRLKSKPRDLFFRLILVLNVCTVFSNSFVVEEASALLYLYVGVVIFVCYNSLGTEKKWKFRILIISMAFTASVLSRLSTYFWQCREEQEWCLTFGIHKDLSANLSNCILSVVILSVQVILVKIWLRNCGNLTGNSVTILFARYVPTVMVVCISGYWILKNIPQNVGKNLNTFWEPDILACTFYCLLTIGVVCLIWNPLTTYEMPKTNAYEGVPQIFQQVKKLFSKYENQEGVVPVVYGLATVYSSCYVIMGSFLSLLFSLLLGGLKAPSFVIFFFAFFLTIAIVSSAKIMTLTRTGKKNYTERRNLYIVCAFLFQINCLRYRDFQFWRYR